jgi:hypothetical protein
MNFNIFIDAGDVISHSIFTDNGITKFGDWQQRAQCKKGYFGIGCKVRVCITIT